MGFIKDCLPKTDTPNPYVSTEKTRSIIMGIVGAILAVSILTVIVSIAMNYSPLNKLDIIKKCAGYTAITAALGSAVAFGCIVACARC